MSRSLLISIVTEILGWGLMLLGFFLYAGFRQLEAISMVFSGVFVVTLGAEYRIRGKLTAYVSERTISLGTKLLLVGIAILLFDTLLGILFRTGFSQLYLVLAALGLAFYLAGAFPTLKGAYHAVKERLSPSDSKGRH